MAQKVIAVVMLGILMALPQGALAAQVFKNHGQCVSACVQDLGVAANKDCTRMCKDGTYGQDPVVPPPPPPPPPVVEGLPFGAVCEPAFDVCAAPYTCQPVLFMGWVLYSECR